MPTVAIYYAMEMYKIITRKNKEQEEKWIQMYYPLREHLDLRGGKGRKNKPAKKAKKVRQESRR